MGTEWDEGPGLLCHIIEGSIAVQTKRLWPELFSSETNVNIVMARCTSGGVFVKADIHLFPSESLLFIGYKKAYVDAIGSAMNVAVSISQFIFP